MTTSAVSPPFSPGKAIREAALDYVRGFKGLLGCPREIWVVYLLKIIESLCYFSAVLMLMPFLTKDMGYDDVTAGTIAGIFSASFSFFMLFIGFVGDALGVKRAILAGFVVALVGRIAISFSTDPRIVFPGLFCLSIGFASLIPLLTAAVKQYTDKSTQSYGFSWYYVMMNVGALVAGLTIDALRTTFTKPFDVQVASHVLTVRPTQVVFLMSVGLTVVSLLIAALALRKRVPGFTERKEAEEHAAALARASAAGKEAPKAGHKESALTIARDIMREKAFWLFIAFIGLCVLVKMIFQYNNLLYPLYMDRIGLKAWTGKLYAINPFIIIFLVPVVTAFTRRMRAYNVIILGTFVSASSVLFMTLGESIWLIVAFQVFLSFGEALWSPRLYDYTASIAPPGREATYMSYSMAPMFVAKVGAGPMAGILLAHLAPATGPRNTELMWLIVGLSTLVSPIALLLLKRKLDVEKRTAS